MKKGVLLCALLALSGLAHAADNVKPAYTGPDCSKKDGDIYGRIESGIIDSFQLDNPVNEKHMKYFNQLSGKDIKIKVTRLSSIKINKKEARSLMMRRAKMDEVKESDIKSSGLNAQYLGGDLYLQYYLIESSKGFKAIAKYYSAEGSCGNDLEDIYIISDHINGHTADFSWR